MHKYLTGVTIECGQGWHELINQLCIEIERVLPPNTPIKIRQIKEKFGGLRFYADADHIDKVFEIIQEYERVSFTICENCGATEKVVTKPVCGWIKTFCEECHKIKLKNRKMQ